MKIFTLNLRIFEAQSELGILIKKHSIALITLIFKTNNNRDGFRVFERGAIEKISLGLRIL